MKTLGKTPTALMFVVLVTAAAVRPAHAVKLGDLLEGDVGDVLKGGAVLVLTSALSDQLNDFINTVTMNKGVPAHASTKVVPLIALGSGTRVGAAQVSGPADLVNKTEAVIQIETKFGLKNLDVEAFVPSDSINPLNFNRVEGIGVSALVDMRVSGL